MPHRYVVAGIEPPLEELLNDGIAHLLMRRDGIEPADVWRAVEVARSRLLQSIDPTPEAEPRGAALPEFALSYPESEQRSQNAIRADGGQR
jgi:hypothetical protein